MKKTKTLLLLIGIWLLSTGSNYAQVKKERNRKGLPASFNSKVDNVNYWVEAAQKGIIPFNVTTKDLPPSHFTGSKIDSKSVLYDDSPDVLTYDGTDMTQSENSVAVNPVNEHFLLNSNNSTGWTGSSTGTMYGTSGLISDDDGLNWGGESQSTGGNNMGDPAAAINLNGRLFVGYISGSGGQGVAYSDNQGATWTSKTIATSSGGWGDMLDKNHLTVDNSPDSPYAGHVYSAWTNFITSSSSYSEIEISYSDDDGETWSTPVSISDAINAGSHNQGVNIQTGPNGEVYATWAVYDSWPSDETSLGFSKSLDGGASWSPAVKIIENIKGLRQVGSGKVIRTASFPSMAVDISGGEDDGSIYIVWANVGVPGTNTGMDREIYLIKSTDGGDTWNSPVRVNQDEPTETNVQFMPWMSCDPATGALSVIFYDDRNVGGSELEVFLAVSVDGAETWEDFKISDDSFTPSGIPGLAGEYMGDYIGVTSNNSMVYPVWTDNRDGNYLTYTSPLVLNNLPRPKNLTIELDEETGETYLHWSFEGKGFLNFNIYRDNVLLGTATDTTYTDNLPDYGVFNYKVTAMHDEGESTASSKEIQWGNPKIDVSPSYISGAAEVGQHYYDTITITNTGELELTYTMTLGTDSKGKGKNYCEASGGGDEYISGVELGDISNTGTGEDGYADYTSMSTLLQKGTSYDITVTNGNVWNSDDLGVWIDWNQDEIFDADEAVVCEEGNGGQGTFSFVVPDDALGGETRMRVRIKWSGQDCGDPCGTTSYGEVEDYTIIVQGWLNAEPNAGTIQPGETSNIYVDLDATDMEAGSYEGDIWIWHNGVNASEVDVPVTFNVGENIPTLTPYATPNVICSGGSSMLSVAVVGGSGTYSFEWTSEPEGFTSAVQNPTFENITEETIFTVKVEDGIYTVYNSATVYVTPELEIPTAPSGEDTVCPNTVEVLYETVAVANATSYTWMIDPPDAGTVTGNGLVASVDFGGDYFGNALIMVAAVNDCETGEYASKTVYIKEGLAIPVMPAGEDTVCQNTIGEIYTIEEVTNATSYIWSIVPDEAGTITGDGIEASVDFSDSYEGIASIKVAAVGECGSTGYSEGFDVEVKDCTGISENKNSMISMNIFPNPNNGQFNLNLSSIKPVKADIKVLNILGKEVYSIQSLMLDNAVKTQSININTFDNGIYFIQVTTEKGIFNEKFILIK
jgi:hypothetical protein